MKMILTGEPITAREAEAAGLVAQVTQDELVVEDALALAATIAGKSPIALRVATQTWLASGGKSGEPLERYRARMDALEARLRTLACPRSVIEARDLVLAALADQRAYFESWQREKEGRASRNEALVQSSHSRLVQAYNVLMSRFPQEGAGNRDAFFDHLCALDFI